MGRVDPKGKTVIASVSKGFINPGNIGLLAVDALVLKTPIFGTSVLSSPEKDYLVEGDSLFTFPNTPRGFAEELCAFSNDPKRRLGESHVPTVEEFASRFFDSIIALKGL